MKGHKLKDNPKNKMPPRSESLTHLAPTHCLESIQSMKPSMFARTRTSKVLNTTSQDATTWQLFRCSLHYLRPHWKMALVSVALLVASSGAALLAPWPLLILIDNVLGDRPLPPFLARLAGPLADSQNGLLLATVLGGLLVAVITGLLSVLQSYVNVFIDQRISLDFRADALRHTMRLSLAHHDQERSGMMIYLINNQASAAADLLMSVPALMQSVITITGIFWITFLFDRQLAVLSLVVVPFLYFSVGYYAKNIQARVQEVKMMEGHSLSIVHEAVSMLKVIVTFGREKYEFDRFYRQSEDALKARVQLTLRQTLFSLAVTTITAAGTALVLGFGALAVLQGRLTAGQLLVLLSYLAAVYSPLESISTTVGGLQDQIVSLRMAFGLLDVVPDIKDAPDAVDCERAKGHVSYKNVQFHYRTRFDTLKNVSFEAQPGQVIALVGPTGAGKTTLMSLLPRLYDPQGGTILLDGVDIRSLKLASLRRQISFVAQEPMLFSGTIFDNIRYGKLEASMEEVEAAARAANAHDFIERLPQGYETTLGERGAQLSGGERQRISIARALLKDAPILILDEPTSAIDSRTESVILEALERLMVGRTTFMVAHRLSTVRHADAILVMHHGELVESGTHDELMERGGLYRQLHDMQTSQAARRTRLRSVLSEPLIVPTPEGPDGAHTPTLQKAEAVKTAETAQ
jgi:ATP-binding cassette subfamily B protein/subfamily B ATP-binding cassette protein MsbA